MLFHRLIADRSGNFATFTAILMTGLCGFAGLVIDLSTALTRRAEIQEAADAAVLSVAQMGLTSQTALRYQVEKAFAANDHERFGSHTRITDVTLTPEKRVRVTLATHIPLAMGSLLVPDGFEVDLTSEAEKGVLYPLDVALVLDTTLSMRGQKLADLQAATRSLLSIFQTRAGGTARFAIVPFGQYVNVGTGNRNRPWISVPGDSSTSRNVCTTTSPIISQTCHSVPATVYVDGTPTSSTTSVCSNIVYGPAVTSCAVQTTTRTWNGCVGSRDAPLDQSDAAPASPYAGIQNFTCASPLTPLTSDFTALNRAVSALSVTGDTYIPAGLVWGLNTLSPAEPFAEASSDPRDTKRYMVLMTDGDNSLRALYPAHGGAINGNAANDTLTRNSANAKMLAVCDAAKASGITVFTVSVGSVLPSSLEALSSCASDPSKSINIRNSADLLSVFNDFAGRIMSTRLTQ